MVTSKQLELFMPAVSFNRLAPSVQAMIECLEATQLLQAQRISHLCYTQLNSCNTRLHTTHARFTGNELPGCKQTCKHSPCTVIITAQSKSLLLKNPLFCLFLLLLFLFFGQLLKRGVKRVGNVAAPCWLMESKAKGETITWRSVPDHVICLNHSTAGIGH